MYAHTHTHSHSRGPRLSNRTHTSSSTRTHSITYTSHTVGEFGSGNVGGNGWWWRWWWWRWWRWLGKHIAGVHLCVTCNRMNYDREPIIQLARMHRSLLRECFVCFSLVKLVMCYDIPDDPIARGFGFRVCVCLCVHLWHCDLPKHSPIHTHMAHDTLAFANTIILQGNPVNPKRCWPAADEPDCGGCAMCYRCSVAKFTRSEENCSNRWPSRVSSRNVTQQRDLWQTGVRHKADWWPTVQTARSQRAHTFIFWRVVVD